MNTRQLQLGDMQHIEMIRHRYNHNTSSHAFETIYIWRDELGLEVYDEDELFAVKCNTRGNNTWFFPCGNDDSVYEFIDKADKDELRFCYMREEDTKFLNDNFPGMFEIIEKDCDHEYLYSCVEWNELKGSAFAGIRNHIKRACRDNELRVELIDGSNIGEVRNLIHRWKSESIANGDESDNVAAAVLIDNYNALNAHGIAVYVNNILFAVVAGFPLSDECFDMCLAKQSDRLSGLSVYAKYEFVKTLPKQYAYFNAEEDLGVEGLRIMKQQMKPIGQIKMFEGKFIRKD